MSIRLRMPIRLRHAVALTAAVAAAALAGAGPARAVAAPHTTTDPATAAAGWLAQQFVGASGKPTANGDHLMLSFGGTDYPDYGGTADAIFGLAAAKAGASKIQAAMSYLAANANAYSSVDDTSGKPGPYDGSVAKLALAAMVAGADATSVGGHDLLRALGDDECTAVSMPAGDNDLTTPTCPAAGAARNIFSSVSESLAIIAEARGGGGYAPSAAAKAYFLSLQCPDGGFTGLTSACSDNSDASVDETAYASMALTALGGHAAELDRADAWLTSRRSPAGYWVTQGGPDVDSTGLAAAALDAAGRDVSASRAWLMSQQVRTGPTLGAGASRGALKYQGAFDPSSSVKSTADGLLGLAPHGGLATLTAAGASASAPVLALGPATARSASVRRGGTQTVTAAGFSAGEPVTGVLHSDPVAIGSARASATGTATLTFTVPAALAPGSHTVVLTGARSGLRTTSAAFTVTAAPAVPAGGGAATAPLADTGLDGRRLTGEVLIGAALLLAGAGAGYAGRRRRA